VREKERDRDRERGEWERTRQREKVMERERKRKKQSRGSTRATASKVEKRVTEERDRAGERTKKKETDRIGHKQV